MSDPIDQAIGLREANKALRSLPALVQEELQPTFDATAFQVARAAASLAPELAEPDPRRERGVLKRAIDWKSRPRTLAAVVRIDHAKAFYWKFVEFGTIKHAAVSFFRRAAERLRNDHQARVIEALTRAKGRMERHEAPRTSTLGNTGLD